MATEAPQGSDSELGADFNRKVSDSDVARAEERPAEHHSQFCPNCGKRLTGHRCKLICDGCGYYMSCADYY